MKDLMSINDIEKAISENEFVMFYFSTPECNVCKHLKPKIEAMSLDFEKLNLYYVNLHDVQEASGRFSVFSIPTIIMFINGSETIRESRYLSVEEVKSKISRYYDMYFEK